MILFHDKSSEIMVNVLIDFSLKKKKHDKVQSVLLIKRQIALVYE